MMGISWEWNHDGIWMKYWDITFQCHQTQRAAGKSPNSRDAYSWDNHRTNWGMFSCMFDSGMVDMVAWKDMILQRPPSQGSFDPPLTWWRLWQLWQRSHVIAGYFYLHTPPIAQTLTLRISCCRTRLERLQKTLHKRSVFCFRIQSCSGFRF